MKSLKPINFRILAGLALALLFVAYLLHLAGIDRWVSPRDESRHFEDIEFYTASETPKPTTPPALSRKEVQRKQTKEKLLFVWKDTRQHWTRAMAGHVPPRLVDDKKQMISLPGGGSIRVGWAGMGYHPDLSSFPIKEKFTPTEVIVRGDTWEPLNDTAFREYQEEVLGFKNTVSPFLSRWSPGKSSLDLHFIHEGVLNLRAVSTVELINLDTLTKVDWNTGGSLNSYREGVFLSMPAIDIFHPARIAAGFDVAYGAFEEATFSMKAGEREKLSDLEMEILAIERIGYSSGHSSGCVKRTKNEETRTTGFEIDSSRDPVTSILFSLSPQEMGHFCDIVLVNKAGEEEVRELRKTYLVDYVTTKTPPEELSELRLRYRPHQARLVFELPPLPGIPEFNRNTQNLFDVTVPHLKITRESNLKRAIAKYAAVEMLIPDAAFPGAYFPRYYENTTARELLNE